MPFNLSFLPELTPAGIGIWTLVIIALTTLIKTWPHLRKLSMDENERLRDDRRADYREVKSELEAVRVRTEAMERYGAAVSLRLGQLEFVFSLVMDELELIAPDNEIAKRARLMISTLYPIPPISEHIQEFIDTMKAHHSTAEATVRAANPAGKA